MAGVVAPTVFLLVAFIVFCAIRLGPNPQFPIERVMVFPLALVPAIWGGWNMVYIALAGRRRLPLGLHGAIVPLALIPLALLASRAFGFDPPFPAQTLILTAVPPLMIVYYLLWKYLVGFLNDLVGIS
jgi:hypothetical protein